VARGAPLMTLRTPLRRLGHQERLAVASSTLTSGPPAGRPSSDPSAKARTVFIDLGEFPERWSDYEAVDAVLLDSSDTARLGETQRSALRRWTLVGGAVSLLSRAGRGADGTLGAGTAGPGNASGGHALRPRFLPPDCQSRCDIRGHGGFRQELPDVVA